MIKKRGVFFTQKHESFIDYYFLKLRGHSSVHIQKKQSFHLVFFFLL